MRYQLVAFENTGEHQMREYRAGDPIAPIDRLFEFDAETTESALERLWEVGNKMAADDEGTEWPRDRRSMCTGDLVTGLIRQGSTLIYIGVWACDTVGWKPLPEYLKHRAEINEQIKAQIAEDRRVSPR